LFLKQKKRENGGGQEKRASVAARRRGGEKGGGKVPRLSRVEGENKKFGKNKQDKTKGEAKAPPTLIKEKKKKIGSERRREGGRGF